MRRRWLAAGVLVVASSTGWVAAAGPDPVEPAPERVVCWEDQPCWARGPKSITLTDDHGQWWPCWAIDVPCSEEG